MPLNALNCFRLWGSPLSSIRVPFPVASSSTKPMVSKPDWTRISSLSATSQYRYSALAATHGQYRQAGQAPERPRAPNRLR